MPKDELPAKKPDQEAILDTKTESLQDQKSREMILESIIPALPDHPESQRPSLLRRFAPALGTVILAIAMIIVSSDGDSGREVVIDTNPDSGDEEPAKRPLEERLQLAEKSLNEANEIYDSSTGFWADDEEKILDALGIAASAWVAICDGRYPQDLSGQTDEPFLKVRNRLATVIENCADQLDPPEYDRYVWKKEEYKGNDAYK